jgi:glycerate dehydrogenase
VTNRDFQPATERIVLLDGAAFTRPMRPLELPHEWVSHVSTTPSEVDERLREASIAITNQVPITADVIARAERLRMVAVAATGFNHVDIAACERAGIVVSNVRNWSVSVPEHVFAMTLALRRQLAAYQAAVRAGDWERSPVYGLMLEPLPRALHGSTLGLIGHGGLGQRVETIARGFGMDVLVADRKGASPRPGRVAFDEVVSRSDVLVVMCPLTPETRGLIGEREIGLMKRDALLINCARGGIVDEVALADALRAGRIGGAGVDVLSEEPPSNGNPLLDPDLPNLIVTPHMAWASVESEDILLEETIRNIEAFVAGDPRNAVTS